MIRVDGRIRFIIIPMLIVTLTSLLGIWVHGKVEENRIKSNQMYETAIPADHKETYDYVLDTQQGIFYTHSDFIAIKPVTFPRIGGEYMKVVAEEEHYEMRTRTVSYVDEKGNTKTKTETYWEWVYYGSKTKQVDKVKVHDHIYDFNKFTGFDGKYITTKYLSSDVRITYYGVPKKLHLTFLADASENGLQSVRGKDSAINVSYTAYDKFVESKLSKGILSTILIVIGWIALTIGLIYGYFYIENN